MSASVAEPSRVGSSEHKIPALVSKRAEYRDSAEKLPGRSSYFLQNLWCGNTGQF